MRIGIDISQIAYEGTGVGIYIRKLVENLLTIDKENEYILFFSSMRKKFPISNFQFLPAGKAGPISDKNVKVKTFKLPPIVLDLLWNRLHIFPVEWFIGHVDIFISSDWTQPPTIYAKKVTILYDLIVYKYPQETDDKIVNVQKRRLKWVKKECDAILCISKASKQDAIDILEIPDQKLKVIYPGVD